jgi:hypothetical protein
MLEVGAAMVSACMHHGCHSPLRVDQHSGAFNSSDAVSASQSLSISLLNNKLDQGRQTKLCIFKALIEYAITVVGLHNRDTVREEINSLQIIIAGDGGGLRIRHGQPILK